MYIRTGLLTSSSELRQLTMKLSVLIFLGFSLVAISSAETCTPGYYKLKSGVCRKCPKGTFQAKSDKYACRPCPPGKVATEEGSSKCTRCTKKNTEPNKRRDKCVCVAGTSKDSGKCKPCKPGTIEDGGYCSSCSEGYFQPKAGQTECLKCPAGSVSTYGATECVTCAEDEDFTDEGKCVRCKAGETFSKYGGCSKCERNRYKPKAGNGPCLPCPIGTHSVRGAKRCLPCPKGTVLLKSGECGTCPAGSFFTGRGRKCKECGFHEFTPHKNVRTSCYSCSGKEFALKGSSKCVTCPKHSYLLKDGTCKQCPQGSIYERYSLRCQKCSFNTFTRGDMTYCESCDDKSYALPGSTTCFTCPDGTALILKKKDCGSCPAGKYYDKYSAKCTKCYEGSIMPERGVETSCQNCPNGMTSNKERTECIPEH